MPWLWLLVGVITLMTQLASALAFGGTLMQAILMAVPHRGWVFSSPYDAVRMAACGTQLQLWMGAWPVGLGLAWLVWTRRAAEALAVVFSAWVGSLLGAVSNHPHGGGELSHLGWI